MNKSIRGDEANKRTIMCNTRANKIKRAATQFVENRKAMNSRRARCFHDEERGQVGFLTL